MDWCAKSAQRKPLGIWSPKAIHIRGWTVELFLTFANLSFSCSTSNDCCLNLTLGMFWVFSDLYLCKSLIDFEITCTVIVLKGVDCSKTRLISKILFQLGEMMKTSQNQVKHSYHSNMLRSIKAGFSLIVAHFRPEIFYQLVQKIRSFSPQKPSIIQFDDEK